MIDPNRFWDVPEAPDEDDEHPHSPPPKGATPKALARWEARHGVALPEPLRSALLIQNGGLVRDSAIEVDALKEIGPVDEDFWEEAELDEADVPDRSLVFAWGRALLAGGTLLLDFNSNGPTGPPSVLFDHGDGSVAELGTIEQFLAGERATTDDAPSLSWSEAEGQAEILATETVTAFFGARSTTRDQILARTDAGLVLFTRERSGGDELLDRTELPLPLEPGRTVIEPVRLPPDAIFALRLRPRRARGARLARSSRFGDGRWLNQSSVGIPSKTRFEARDRARLDALRVALLGVEGATEAAGHDKNPAAKPGAPSPEQAQAGLIGLLLASMPPERREDLIANSVEQAVRQVAGQDATIPPGLAEAAQAARRRLAESLQGIQPPPAPPETDPPG